MGYHTAPVHAMQQAIPNGCPAKALPASQRLLLGLHAAAGTRSITNLAADVDVSRKFVYQQCAIAEQALGDAFHPPAPQAHVLFYLPVTKAWLNQLVLGLVLICHSPLRGVVELLHDLFDYDLALGTVFNIVRAAIPLARQHSQAVDLRSIRIGGHDEIFQAGQPVLAGIDLESTYCYLLSCEDQRDGDTWGVHLLDLQQRGFDPDAIVADGGLALRAAHAEVFPDRPCRSDHFHALQEVTEVVTKLENRAYRLIQNRAAWAAKIARARQQGRRPDAACVKRLSAAAAPEAQAIAVADAVALLAAWLHDDVLALHGPPHADRVALYDFVVAELQARVPQAPDLLGRLVTYLKGQRDDLLDFAVELDRGCAELAARFAVPLAWVREMFAVHTLAEDCPQRWQRDAPLRRQLAERYHPLNQAVAELRRGTIRASSLVENLNSRLRSYFFLRRHLGNDYLALLQFFLNHRVYARSERPERVGKSPAALLTGQAHPHWLELLGYTRFCRN